MRSGSRPAEAQPFFLVDVFLAGVFLAGVGALPGTFFMASRHSIGSRWIWRLSFVMT